MLLTEKDPDDIVDFRIDLSAELREPTPDTIETSEWLASVPEGLLVEAAPRAPYFDETTVTVWVSGGVDRQMYELTNRVVTAGGRRLDTTLYVQVRQR